ncbi:MAG: class I SAM-dependent methyltransferase [Nitrospirae bacterium]|nr:class I SAM-dependent methyltransferase [Candidatus Manganitrophaceae bacterium]
MLDQKELDAEGVHELQMRDEYSAAPPEFETSPWEEYWDQLETAPTLATLNLTEDSALLEFACGTGRYTTKLVGRCRTFVAVDFSMGSLRALAATLPSDTEIGLVQADITRLVLSPQSFDRVLSTTCLDNREQRMAMHRLAADALAEKGRYVYSIEFYNLRIRLLGLPRAQRYTPGGMLFCNLDKNEVIRETAPFFEHLKVRPIQVAIPLARFLTYKWRVIVARVFEKLPFTRDLGTLLLISAEKPIRPIEEGQYSPGNKFAKAIYRWYYKVDPGTESKEVQAERQAK